MRTLLINTPYPSTECPTMPQGLAYIAAVLEKEGIEVQVLDFLITKYSKGKLERKIADFTPEIIGVTSVTMNYPIASKILHDCKEIDSNLINVIGGPHVSFWAEEALAEAPWIDIVVRGEGEYTMLEIARGKSLREIDGIAFRENRDIVLTEPRPWIENLDKLPFPARHLFPLSRYLTLSIDCGIITSRGCPFNCIFCLGPKMVGRKGRFRNTKLIVDEIEEILEYGFKTINVADDLFTLNRKHLYAFCDEVMARKLKFKWSANSRVDTVDPELLGKMKEAGCSFICYGVESGNQKILDITRKKITREKIREAAKLTKDAGIKSLASFIIGLPGETKETLKESVNFANELGPHYAFHLLAPFPGTEVRERTKEYGLRLLTNDWLKYNANEAIIETEGVSAAELTEIDRKYQQEVERYVSYLEELEKSGKLDSESIEQEELEEVKARRRGEITFKLLQGDIIEDLGSMETKGDVIEELVARVSKEIAYPLHYLKQVTEDMVSQGILKYELHQGNVIWRWG